MGYLLRIAVTLLLFRTLLPGMAAASGKGVFLFGSDIDAQEHYYRSWLNLDTLLALRFNAFAAVATDTPTTPYYRIGIWDSLGVHVRADNGFNDPYLASNERGAIFETMAANTTRSALYNLWEAEDSTKFSGTSDISEATWGISHEIGVATSDGWVVDAALGHQAGIMQTGPDLGLGGVSMIDSAGNPNVRLYTIQYRLRFHTDTTVADTVSICKLTGTLGVTPGEHCSLNDTFYSQRVTVGDLRVDGSLGMWKIFEFRDVHFVKFREEAPSCSAEFYRIWNAAVRFNVRWHGVGRLELDWTRCFSPNGRDLVLNEDPQFQNQIYVQANSFINDSVWMWFGGESGHFHPDMIDAFHFINNLVDSATGHRAFAQTDMGVHFHGIDSIYFNFHMYRMLKYGNMKHLLPWWQPFAELDTLGQSVPYAHDVDSINSLWYDTLTNRMNKWIMRWVDTIPGFRVVPYVQVWANTQDTSDVAPTANDVACLCFMWLAHGAKGLNLYRYDGGVWSNGDSGFGLAYNYPYNYPNPSGPIYLSKRYYAVKNRVSPLLMDSVAGWGELLVKLDWRGAGRADTLAGNGASWNLVKSFTSSVTAPARAYVEAGFLRDSTLPDDYIMLINRRTPDSTSQQVTIGIDVTKLASPGQTHYYIIALNPQDTLVGADTILAGPISSEVKFSTSIRPGSVKFYKITPAPDRIFATNFPDKWWGEIHAGNSLTLSTGRELRLEAPLTFKMHLDSGSLLKFSIHGKLTAIGTPSSPILFTRVQGGDNGIWGGLSYSGWAPACTLQYCNFEYAGPAITTASNLLLDDITTTLGLDTACIVQPGGVGGNVTMTDCSFDGTVLVKGGRVRMDNCEIDSARIGLEVYAAGYWNDSTVVTHTKITNSDTIAILASGYSVRVQSCTLSVADIGIVSKAAAVHVDSVYVNGCTQGVFIDTNATIGGKGLRMDSCPIGMIFRKGWGTLDSSYVISTDTGVVADPGSGHALTFTRLGVIGSEAKKGVAARSGEISLINSHIYANSLTGLEAYYGNAVVRLDTVDIEASPTSSAAVSIGPDARIVARKCNIHSSYMGIELKHNGADTITNCTFTDNALYGMWFDSGSVADYIAYNTIGNDTASSVNVGVHILKQSIVSVGGVVNGGYNWDFNINTTQSTHSTADINGLFVKGKPGDDWGLVLNGINGGDDSAWVEDCEVDSTFSYAHMYVRDINAKVYACRLNATGSSSNLSNYGIYDNGGAMGYVRCTRAVGQKTACIYRAFSSTMDFGTTSNHGENTFYTTVTNAKYVTNAAVPDLVAKYNWWGSSSPDTARFSGYVTYSPYLTQAGCADILAKIASTEADVRPVTFSLKQNHPNPFNPTTTIEFTIPSLQDVRLDIFNVLGQRVRTFGLGLVPAGYHSLEWPGTNEAGGHVGSGLYFYRLTTPQFTATKKMLLLK